PGSRPAGRRGLRYPQRDGGHVAADTERRERHGQVVHPRHPCRRGTHDRPDRAGAHPARQPGGRGSMTIPAQSAGAGRDRSLVEGEFLFTNEDFTSIARMLYDDAGIALSESKASLVYSRLAKRLRALGLESFREYCSFVAGTEGAD